MSTGYSILTRDYSKICKLYVPSPDIFLLLLLLLIPLTNSQFSVEFDTLDGKLRYPCRVWSINLMSQTLTMLEIVEYWNMFTSTVRSLKHKINIYLNGTGHLEWIEMVNRFRAVITRVYLDLMDYLLVLIFSYYPFLLVCAPWLWISRSVHKKIN